MKLFEPSEGRGRPVNQGMSSRLREREESEVAGAGAIRMDASAKIAGIEALRQGDAAAALAELTLATDAAPADAEAWGYLGVAYGKAGEPAQAVRCLEMATRLVPASAPLWHNLGNALEQDGRGGEALDAYRRALAFDPGYPYAQDALARLERMLALAATGVAGDPERTIIPTGQEAPAAESAAHDRGMRGPSPAPAAPNGIAPAVESPAASTVSPEPAAPQEFPARHTSNRPVEGPIAPSPQPASPAQTNPLRTPPRLVPERGRSRVNPRARGTASLLILLGVAVAVALGWLLVQAGEWLTPKPRPLPPGFPIAPGLREPGGLNLPASGAPGVDLNAPDSLGAGGTAPESSRTGALRNPSAGAPVNGNEPSLLPPGSANVPAAPGPGGAR